ncbi:MAG: hypothetical protein BGO67_04955 [Alphaproteobacteria bacterium 41-28]|nr:MAG: hypothetical protein BGO67_04955 [Alphaproteobacteria bacterium 41-28]
MMRFPKLTLTLTVLGGVLLTSPVWSTRGGKSDSEDIADLSGKHALTNKEFRRLILKNMKKREIIDLSQNTFDDETVVKMSKALESNRTVKTLTLAECKINGIQAITLFEKGLPTNNSLENLDLSHNEITGTGIVSLSRVLPRNTALVSLKLSQNPIGPDVGPQIGKALEGNHHLKKLELGQVGLDDIALGHIVKGLNQNSSLSDFDLSDNPLGNGGAINIKWVLHQNNTLQTLDLSRCNIRDAGLEAIGSGLKRNKGLDELRLAGNLFGDEALKKFEKRITKAGFGFDRKTYIVTRTAPPLTKAKKEPKSKKLSNGISHTNGTSSQKLKSKENGKSNN